MDFLVETLLELTRQWGYLGIFVLMAVESSFIPFPSEVVIPPAAYLASLGEMNLILIIIFGILGSLVGAFVNYYLALYLGRPLIYALIDRKWAKYLLLNSEKLKKSENYFIKYGNLSTFIGRLVPVVRQLISLPAGFAKMNVFYFTLFTTLGAGIWVVVLALLGFYFGEEKELLQTYYLEVSIISILVAITIFILNFFFRKR